MNAEESEITQPLPSPTVGVQLQSPPMGARGVRAAIGRVPRLRVWATAIVLFAFAVGFARASLTAGLAVSDLRTSVQAGQAHLAQVEQLGTRLSASPLDQGALRSLSNALAATEHDFLRAQGDVTLLAPGTIIPGIGPKIGDAQALLEMAVMLTGGARTVIDAALPVLDSLRSPLAVPSATPTTTALPTAQAAPLTTAQLAALRQAIKTCAGDLDQATQLRARIHDNGADLDASVPHLLARYDQAAPTLRQLLADADTLTLAAPALLGVAHPASYLIEVLDQTELRGGGGFMGNYGLLSVSDGHAANAALRDTYLLDDPYLASHARAFPPEYTWFPLSSSMGLRDSNLSPDFVYDAQLAEKILTEESGQSVEGVLAITPEFISRLLTITGPVVVPGYNVTVTSQNLVKTIHYYQFQTSDNGVPSSDGISSTRKHFTAVLGEAVFTRVRALPQAALAGLLTLARDNLKTKDLQLYVNDAGTEALLVRARLANSFATAAGATHEDMLALVDNNIGGNKAYLYVSEAASDTVALESDGSHHTLTVRYTYRPSGDIYGARTFADEVQVFAPPGSTLVGRSGLDATQAPSVAYGRVVFGGTIYLTPNVTRTVEVSWLVPLATGTAHDYALLLTRQAGSVTSFAMTIHAPGSAGVVRVSSPLTANPTGATYKSAGPLTGDLALQMRWG